MPMSSYFKAASYFYRLMRNLHLDKAELAEDQNRCLRAIVKNAYDSVPFYREKFDAVGVKPGDVKSVEDLTKLPIIKKDEIKRNIGCIVSTAFDQKSLRVLSTSGSTGQPLQMMISKEEDTFRKAKHLRANYSCGHRPFDKWITVTSPSHFSEISGFQKRLGFYAPSFVSVFWDISRQISTIKKFNPRILDGYSSSLSLLAREVKKSNIEEINPKMIFGGAELLDDLNRKNIEEVFDAPLYDQYATIEFERMAWQCPEKSGYHIDADSVVMEFLDEHGCKVSSGESGEIVCTSLFNYAMPLIRYSVGDIGVPSDEECSCGRSLPIMKKIEGRSDSVLLLPHDRRLSPRAITVAIGKFPFGRLVEQFHVIQKKIDLFEIQIKTDNSPESKVILENELPKHFNEVLGLEHGEVTFEIQFVDDIKPDKTGKLTIISTELSDLQEH
jgi:phenylacetate-coenzyme A ligase PaaK-like adenylate-forming protein